MKTRTTILRAEILEDRCTPTTFGNPWPDASHLTLSFVPDGTKVGTHSSNLFQSLNAIAPTSVWETEILRAFQTWAARSNINVSVVTDDGSPLGTTGAMQSDARFGDIRIAAFASGPDEEGSASAFQMAAGTWSGDVQLNTAAAFSVTGSAGAYDLYSVMLHEAGHVFGLDHNIDSSSAMFEDYAGVRPGLGASDVTNLQSLYGTRTPDQWEGVNGNGQFSTATRLNSINNGSGSFGITVNSDITTLQDKDIYSFNTLLSFGAIDVAVRTAGNSLLAPHAAVYDSAGRIVAQALATNPMQGGFVIHLTNVRPLSTYYIQVDSGRPDVFGIGSYQITLNQRGLLSNLLAGVTATVNYGLNGITNVLINTDQHSNDSFTTATALPPMTSSSSGTWSETYRGSISDASDVDFFKLQTPANSSGSTFTAMVWGLQNQLDARVRVFDAQRNLVVAKIIVNDSYSYAIQIANVASQATYYVKIVAANSTGARNVGNYFIGLIISPNAVILHDFASGAVSNTQQTSARAFTLSQKQLFHFVLSADAGGSTNATVRMTIKDASGNVVFTLTAGTTEAVSGDVALDAGAFSVQFMVISASGGALPNMTFAVRGDTLNNPIGPEPTDPTEDPGSSPGTGSPPTDPWTGGDGNTGVPPQDPSTPPYTGDDGGTDSTDDDTSPSEPPPPCGDDSDPPDPESDPPSPPSTDDSTSAPPPIPDDPPPDSTTSPPDSSEDESSDDESAPPPDDQSQDTGTDGGN